MSEKIDAHILGDPNMSEDTKKALVEMIEAAAKAIQDGKIKRISSPPVGTWQTYAARRAALYERLVVKTSALTGLSEKEVWALVDPLCTAGWSFEQAIEKIRNKEQGGGA